MVSSVHGVIEGSEFGFHLRDYVHQRNQRGGFRNLSGCVLKSTKREVEKQLAKHSELKCYLLLALVTEPME